MASTRPECPSCGKSIAHREGVDWCRDRQMSEKTLQNRIVARAKTRGWRVAHAGKGIVGFNQDDQPIFATQMAAGFPDLLLAKPGHHLIFVELKRQEGVLAPEQLDWLQLINRSGNFAVEIRPSDLRMGRVNEILAAGAPL